MPSANKVRFVVGLFDTAEELRSALVELRERHLRPAQVKVIARPEALQGTLRGWSERPETQSFDNPIEWRSADSRFPWAIAANDRVQAASPAEPPRRHIEQLDRHLREGAALLLIEPETDVEERAACTALLLHASGGVQTHEITRPQEP